MSRHAAATLALAFVLILTLAAGSSRAAAPLAQTEIPDSEYQALVALYNATDGPRWGPSRGWMLDDSPCSWGGVTCEEGHVHDLLVVDADLVGSIPPELGNLGHLECLNLAFNQLSGPIPPKLGNLINLRRLDLYENQLNGSIPPELGNLVNLEVLSLFINELSGPIPGELGNLDQLEYLDLSSNRLTGAIPAELGNLDRLGQMWLQENQLSGPIPPELGNCTLLFRLMLDSNQLAGPIPPDLARLSNLQLLSIQANRLDGSIPAELGQMPNLRLLALSSNRLSGTIPAEICDMSSVTFLSLNDNELTGSIPSEMGRMTNLKLLWLFDNPLSGSLPTSLTALASLSAFHFDHTALCIPDDPDFQAWLDSLALVVGTETLCSEGRHSVLGKVSDTLDQRIAGAAITFGPTETTVTDACGYFAQALPPGTYTVTPAKDGYWFVPPSRQATTPPDAIGLDFLAYPCAAPSGLDVCSLQAGDILLARTADAAADLPFSAGNSYFTHAALYLGAVAAPGGDADDVRPRLAEAATPDLDAADQVRELWLTDSLFWSGEGLLDWAVVRPGAPEAVKVAAVQLARDLAADPAVYSDPRAAKDDDAGYYCSKLIWRAYRDVADGVDLEGGGGAAEPFAAAWVTPDELYLSGEEVAGGRDEPLAAGRFVATLWSPAHLTLVDPEGRRAGYDAATGGVLAEIPGAWYAAPPEVEVETITAAGVGPGWRVEVTGYDSGAYRFIYRYLNPGTMAVLRRGETAAGLMDPYALRGPAAATYLPMIWGRQSSQIHSAESPGATAQP